jgi:hypothetical protein
MITNRYDISKFSYFGEEGSCYFDFTAFIDDIIDIILYTDYPYINDDKMKVFADEDGRLIELSIG